MSKNMNEGAGAFVLQRPISANPYQMNSIEHKDWEAGWRRQRFLDAMESPEVVYSNPWFRVEKVENYHWIAGNGHGGAVVLPVREGPDEKEVLFVEHFRHLCGGIKLELPRGAGEKEDRDASETAIRELMEETGYRVPRERLEPLGRVNPDSGILKSSVPIFVAFVEDDDKVSDDLDEVDGRIWLMMSEVRTKIAAGEITDSFTMNALLLFELIGS